MTNPQQNALAEALEAKAAWIAKDVADQCHAPRKPGDAPHRYAMIFQAARLGALGALASNNPAAVEGQGETVTISRKLYDFLMGVGEIDQTSFGDLHRGMRGAFWWRALLQADARDHERAAIAPNADREGV